MQPAPPYLLRKFRPAHLVYCWYILGKKKKWVRGGWSILYMAAWWMITGPVQAQPQYGGRLRVKKQCKLPKSLPEVSGMVFYQQTLIALNDGGHPPQLQRVHPKKGTLLQTLSISGVTNHDWEELAEDSSYLYIADIGNNTRKRDTLTVYRVAKATLEAEQSAVPQGIEADSIQFVYPGNTADQSGLLFDCEAVVVLNDTLHLFSKNWLESYSKHYTVPARTGAVHLAQLVDSVHTRGFLPTGATLIGNRQLFLVGYNLKGQCALFYAENWQPNAASQFVYYRLPWVLRVGQVEAIGHQAGKLYISNERMRLGFFTRRQALWQVRRRP